MFNTNEDNTQGTLPEGHVTRDMAKGRIIELAKAQGIQGSFKVFYQNNLISTPDELPDTLTLGDVRVSAVLDQASSAWVVVI